MMNNLKKSLNLIFIITAIFSALVLTGVETFAKSDMQADNVLLAIATPASTSVPAPTALTTTSKTATQTTKPAPQEQKPQSIPQKNVYKITHMKQHSLKASLFKFVLAMLCVLISSLVILTGLKFYKKIGLKNKSKTDNIDYSKSLDSPKDLKEAINIFLNKTDK